MELQEMTHRGKHSRKGLIWGTTGLCTNNVFYSDYSCKFGFNSFLSSSSFPLVLLRMGARGSPGGLLPSLL